MKTLTHLFAIASFCVLLPSVKAQDSLFIPTVFHFIQPENIPTEIRQTTLEELNNINAGFNLAPDIHSLIDADFYSLASATNIYFKLATKDPFGDCVAGYETYPQFNGTPETMQEAEDIMDGLSWGSSYCNVFVFNKLPSGFKTIAEFPTSRNTQFGIATTYENLGAYPSANIKALAHWLGLHNVNSTSCSEDFDKIDDTPITLTTSAPSDRCSNSYTPCGEKANMQNFMEAWSTCPLMFTKGQAEYLRQSLTNNPARSVLTTQNNLDATGVLYSNYETLQGICQADFYVKGSEKFCEDHTVLFINNSYYTYDSLLWIFESGEPSVSQDVNPVVSFLSHGEKEVVLTLYHDGASVDVSKTIVVDSTQSTWYNQDFENKPSLSTLGLNVKNEIDSSSTWRLVTHPVDSPIRDSNRCIVLNNLDSTNGNSADELIIGPIDNSSGSSYTSLSFDYAYANKLPETASTATLVFYVSDDCGNTWKKFKTLVSRTTLKTHPATNDEFIPTTDEDWRYFEQSVYHYEKPNVLFKLVFTHSGHENNLYIDNLWVQPVGIQEKEKPQFTLYPNPANNVVFVETALAKGEIQLTDITGKTLKTASIRSNNTQVNLESLKPGIYLVTLHANTNRITKKLIIP